MGFPNMLQLSGMPAAQPAAHSHAPPAAGKVAEGIAAYERALALVPRHAEALYNLGVACTEAGQIDRALFMCADCRWAWALGAALGFVDGHGCCRIACQHVAAAGGGQWYATRAARRKHSDRCGCPMQVPNNAAGAPQLRGGTQQPGCGMGQHGRERPQGMPWARTACHGPNACHAMPCRSRHGKCHAPHVMPCHGPPCHAMPCRTKCMAMPCTCHAMRDGWRAMLRCPTPCPSGAPPCPGILLTSCPGAHACLQGCCTASLATWSGRCSATRPHSTRGPTSRRRAHAARSAGSAACALGGMWLPCWAMCVA